MSASNSNLELTGPVRSEVRRNVVHLVEYSPYPRRDPRAVRRIAYTQDRSELGLGVDLPEAIEPGELLRITLRDIDGEVDIDGLARVVWCRSSVSGRARAGLSILREEGKKPMLRTRNASMRNVSSSRL